MAGGTSDPSPMVVSDSLLSVTLRLRGVRLLTGMLKATNMACLLSVVCLLCLGQGARLSSASTWRNRQPQASIQQ